ncbi:MAG: hypothetical protein KGL38_06335 [Gemmatimonadota bacterium]|nr:hypothetical protein [Gemmatimonadota bacterium]MDE3127604.1 hypothetical protein [Gemmatimonadota bacterium]MDE3174270.1 hypothetical protein [Gemmatimonadota bacterium]
MKRAMLALVAGVFLTAGCYHATVTTGLAPSPEKIDVQWAHGFLWGLVPPSTVDATSKCKSGVAQVETQMSFLNLLANFLTSGIYSPMQITVTCAARGTASAGGAGVVRSHNNPQAAIQEAAERSAQTHQPVFVTF